LHLKLTERNTKRPF